MTTTEPIAGGDVAGGAPESAVGIPVPAGVAPDHADVSPGPASEGAASPVTTASPATAESPATASSAAETRGAEPRAAKSPVRSARRRAREFAMQGLYQWLVSREDAGAIEAHLRESPGFDRCDRAHFRELLHGALGAVDELHAAIAPHLDRRVDELSPVEHATLLVGTFEMARHPEIPYRVVINEAVELAKAFGGTDGFKYVNGVLDRVAASLRPNEAPARSRS